MFLASSLSSFRMRLPQLSACAVPVVSKMPPRSSVPPSAALRKVGLQIMGSSWQLPVARLQARCPATETMAPGAAGVVPRDALVAREMWAHAGVLRRSGTSLLNHSLIVGFIARDDILGAVFSSRVDARSLA